MTFLFSIVILLFSFDSKTLATQQKITETTIQNQDKQLEAFNNIVNKMNTLARNIESRGDLYFDENDVLHFRYKESEYTSDKAVRELINRLEKSGIKTEVTKYTYDDLFKQQMIIYGEVKKYYGDESKLPKFELVPDIYEGKVKFSAESLDESLLEKLMEKHSDVLEFKLKKFNSTGVSEKSVK